MDRVSGVKQTPSLGLGHRPSVALLEALAPITDSAADLLDQIPDSFLGGE